MKHRAPEPQRLVAPVLVAPGLVVLLAAAALGLAGCESLGPTREAGQARVVARLEALQQLAKADEATQSALVAAGRTEFEATHSAGATLGYALALALPGHASHDPATAHRLLEDALGAGSGLDDGERILATVWLAQLDAELKARQDLHALEEQSRQLRDAQAAGRTATARRLLAEIEENVRLRRLLDEARVKLEAVADIAKGRK